MVALPISQVEPAGQIRCWLTTVTTGSGPLRAKPIDWVRMLTPEAVVENVLLGPTVDRSAVKVTATLTLSVGASESVCPLALSRMVVVPVAVHVFAIGAVVTGVPTLMLENPAGTLIVAAFIRKPLSGGLSFWTVKVCVQGVAA